jgi:multidrug efflux pump subunit AcrB
MQQFVRFTLQQKVVLNLLFVLLMVIGAFTLLRMPVERYPNIQFGKMYINTYLPGASPEDIETLITQKIEEGLEDLEKVDYISSSSYRERSNIVIKFEDDSDYEKRFDDVRLKVLSIIGELPDLTEPPVFNFLDVNDWFPTISVNVAGDHTNATLTQVAETIKIPLAQLDGVREVKVSGDYTQEFHIIVSRDKLQRSGITFAEVAEALGRANITLPAGHADTNTGEFVVRVDEQFSKREDLVSTIIRKDGDGSFVRLEDVMEGGYFSFRDPYIMASVNGKDCVTLQILKHKNGNALFIAERVRNIVTKLQPGYAELGISLSVTQDSSTRIEDSIRVLGVNLLLGIVLVCTIIWMFMGFRNAALTTIGIPFAFLVTMVLMYITGNSVNEVSLFAFVLVSGIIVDDAIVVVENIYRHHQMGKSIDSAIITGTSEVFLPVLSATLTTVVAFLPMLIMTGMVGDFFAIIPKTIAFALIASIVECLFILPCHYRDFGPRKVSELRSSAEVKTIADGITVELHREGKVMGTVRALFHKAIVLTLRFRILSLLILFLGFSGAMAIFFGSMQGMTNLMRIQFFPDNYSLYYIEINGPPGTPLEETHQLIKKIATQQEEEGPEQVESALGFAGYYINEDFSPKYGANLGYVAVTLPSSDQRRFEDYPENDVIAHLDTVRKKLRHSSPKVSNSP